MQHISDIDQVIASIDSALALRGADPAQSMRMLDAFIYQIPAVDMERLNQINPLSEEFREYQDALFLRVAGKEHDIQDEGHDTLSDDIATAFPYFMTPRDVGYWTVIYGNVLQKLNLPKKSKVLEIGFGPGGLTELLVRSGLSVTAVDCNVSNCRFIEKRVEAFGGSVRAIAESAAELSLHETFDAIVFFESFHHMIDFKGVLARCKELLKPDGFFLFGAEPIVIDNHPHVPLPWCIRTAGAALCALREVGWVELGFQETFFRAMMEEFGFGYEKSYILNYHHSEICLCRRIAA